MDENELEPLLALNGADFEMAQGLIVEFTARRTEATPERPHGISYALVLRPKAGGLPWLRFDNAHGVAGRGRDYRQKRWSMTIGIGRQKIKVGRTSSQQLFSCLMISGER